MGIIAAKKKAVALVILVNIILTPVVLKQYPAYSCNEIKIRYQVKKKNKLIRGTHYVAKTVLYIIKLINNS